MKLRILAALSIIILVGCSKSPQEKVSDLLRTGYQSLESFEFEKAQEAFNQAVAEAPGYPYDRLGKGLILEQQLFYYDALNEYLDLAVLFPDSALVYGGIYRMYTQFGYHDRALEAAAKYYELSPQSEDAAMAKIQGLFNSREFIMARQEIETAAGEALNKNKAECLTALAYCYLNEFDSARAYLGQVMAAPLTSPTQYLICADVLEATGLIDSAMILSRSSASAASAPVSVIYRHFNRALANNYYGDTRQIIRLLEQRGAGKEITTALEVLIAKDQKNFTKSRVLDSDYLVATPKNISSIIFDMEAGGPQFSDPMTVLSLQTSAQLYMEDNNYNEELKTFVKTQIELFKARSEDLVSAWGELSPLQAPIAQSRQVKLTVAYLEYRTGQFEPALKRLKELRASYSTRPDWLTEIAEIYAHPSIHIFDTALKIYDEALKNDKWYEDAFIGKIKTLRYLGRFREALNEFAKYPQFEKNFREIVMLKALCLSENNDFATAFDIFEKEGVYLKGNIEPFREFASILERKYRDKELLRLAETCAGWAEENVDILMFSARLLNDQKNYAQALELSQKVLTIEPGFIEARIQKGRGLYGLKQRTEALELFEEIFIEQSFDGDINYYFSNILANEKIDHDRATNMARSAVRAFYSDEKAFLNLCQVYAAYGDHKFAYGDAGKGISEFPNSAQLWYQLGLASHNLGRANAEEHLNKAIEFGLGGEDLVKAKEILSKL